MKANGETMALIAPFATWMALMFVLPSAPWAYAVRTFVTLATLAWSSRQVGGWRWEVEQRKITSTVQPSTFNLQPVLWGLSAGLLVLVLWVVPEKLFGWYRAYCMYGYTANAPVDASGWTMRAIRLFGSAFVISVAEELFFRRWLMRYAGFWWSVALFAAGHNRWLVAAITGMIYGQLALRKGLGSAIVAHIVTNLALGIYVLATGDWIFW